MKTLSEMAASTESTALTEQSFLEAIEKARKILNELPLPRPLMFNYRLIGQKHIGDRKWRFRFRTWKERLFSFPWRPLKKMAFYTVVVPKGEFIIDHQNGVVYAHPIDIGNLERAIRDYDSDIIPGNDSIGYRHQTGVQGA